ncbi:MAG: enoyl-CoA hydratase/isomerase family protein, partial [Candidatus Neomarinimicrobiota bacterium]
MTSPEFKFLNIEHDGWIATLTISRPPVNALSQDLVAELRAAVAAVAALDRTSVVLIRSSLPHFCAGADLKERETLSPQDAAAAVADIGACLDAIASLPQPTIAAVNGAAAGGGAELALACDLRIMAEDVRFALTETTLGIIPGAGGTQRLPRIIGPGAAKELIFTARPLDGAACLAKGLANRLAAPQRLEPEARAFAAELARNAPLALRAAK